MSITGGFVLQATTVRVECDLKIAGTDELAYPGLWAEVRRNLTNGERHALKDVADAIDADADALTGANAEAQVAFVAALEAAESDESRRVELIVERAESVEAFVRSSEAIGIRRFDLIAPHIHRWNLCRLDDQGEMVEVPAPSSDPGAALNAINGEIVGWLLRELLGAYRRGFPIGSRRSGAPLEPTPELSAESPKESSPSGSRRSRAKSSSPSPSAFEA